MRNRKLLHFALTESIIGAFYEVYRTLGYGLLEQLYVTALERELRAKGHTVLREVSIKVMYKGVPIGCQRLDMVVDDVVLLEAKATASLPEIAKRQLFNYLRCTDLEVGLLLHFGPQPVYHRRVCENSLKSGEVASVTSVSSVPLISPKAPRGAAS